MSGRIILVVAVLALLLPVVFGLVMMNNGFNRLSQELEQTRVEMNVRLNSLSQTPTPEATPSATPEPTQVLRRVASPTPVN